MMTTSQVVMAQPSFEAAMCDYRRGRMVIFGNINSCRCLGTIYVWLVYEQKHRVQQPADPKFRDL